MSHRRDPLVQRPQKARIFGLFALITLTSGTAWAAEPPPCKAPRTTLAKAEKALKKWRGFAALKGLELSEQHIAPCLSTDNTARYFAMVSRKLPGKRTKWMTDIIVSLHDKTGKPVDTPQSRAQLKRVGDALRKLPEKVSRDSIAATWLAAYGDPEQAMFTDEGGHGAPCFELMGPAKAQGQSLQWCDDKKGVRRVSLRSYGDMPLAALAAAKQTFTQGAGPCALGRVMQHRTESRNRGLQWRITVQMTGQQGCKLHLRAEGDTKRGFELK